jgi:hypothetical protein
MLRDRIIHSFKIEPLLLNRISLESNGFSGCEPGLDNDGKLVYYSMCYVLQPSVVDIYATHPIR